MQVLEQCEKILKVRHVKILDDNKMYLFRKSLKVLILTEDNQAEGKSQERWTEYHLYIYLKTGTRFVVYCANW